MDEAQGQIQIGNSSGTGVAEASPRPLPPPLRLRLPAELQPHEPGSLFDPLTDSSAEQVEV